MSGQWNVKFLGCFGDINTCLLGTCCSCYLFGQNAEKIDGSNKIKMCLFYACLGNCIPCVFHTPLRKKLRQHYNLNEEPTDFLATCLCTSMCANCQEAQELAKRGVADGGRMGGTVTSQPH